MSIIKQPFYIMRHPIEGFDQMIYKKSGDVKVGITIALAGFLTLIIDRQLKGFSFNGDVKLDDINILFLLSKSVILYFLFTLINWAVCTLLDGKGRLKDIWIVVTYSLLPYIVFTLLGVVLSNFFKIDEGIFIDWIVILGQLWSVLLIIKGLEAVHHYSIPQTVLSIAATLLGILIVIFLFVLLLSLTQQIVGFGVTIVKELMLRNY